MKKLIALIFASCLLSTVLLAEDTDFRQKIVGTWLFAYTNTTKVQSTQTMAMETQYRADGTFVLKGELGQTAPMSDGKTKDYVKRDRVLGPQAEDYPYKKQIGGSGVWRIEQGHLISTLTNSVGNWRIDQGKRTMVQTNAVSMETGVERKDKIISMTGQEFTKRDERGRVQTETRKP